jgi:HD-GYP domain-containing protein (c-di-GMP phosphodiesterase class II)
VAALSELLAARLGWEDAELDALRLGARLHDIGKVVVPAAILRKPGPLDADEAAEIRRHPEAGARLLSSIPSARPALPCVLHHHERWDGRGYPHALTGADIPRDARVLAVVDAYDAMTSARPYRPPLAPEAAVQEVSRCAGTQFDPVIADTFVEVWASASLRRVAS